MPISCDPHQKALIVKSMAHKITNQLTELEKVLADAFERTQHQPLMALSHSVELDSELSRMEWSEPITYALHGTATPACNSDQDGAPWRTSPPGTFDCLYQAHRQHLDSPGLALATAFRNARGPEIPAIRRR